MSAEQEVPVVEEIVEESSEELEAEAREMGWVPKEDFRGDSSKWVDAKAFVEHGRHVMPILRKNNERLMEDQRAMRQQVNRLSQELEAARSDFSTLEEFHKEEVVRRVAETRKQLLEQIKDAKRDGDVDAEVDLTDQLTQLTNASKETEKVVKANEATEANKTKGSQNPPLTPDYLEWKAAHPWFEVNAKKTFEAMAVAAAITEDRGDLRGKAFFAELDRRLSGGPSKPAARKVESSRGGSTQSAGNGRTYADLPAEAKAQCDRYTKKFVKPNGQFKTDADYRKHYIQQLETTGYFD